LKPRLHFVLPPPGSGARLPFLLVPVLAGLAVLQLASPERIDLPPEGSVARIGLAALPEPPPVVIAPPLLAARGLFTPPVRQAGAQGPSDPLAGAVIAGVVQQGRLRVAVVRQPGGKLRYVGVGGAVAGWRLASLDQTEARLTRGPRQHLLVAYGTHASPPKASGSLAKTEDEQ